MRHIKLTGEVVLDKNSLKILKDEIRKEVIEDIKNEGLYYEEVTKYLSSIVHVREFEDILKEVMPEFLHKQEKKDFHFDDEKIYTRLRMCYEILML